MLIDPPKTLRNPLNVPHKLLLGAGPANSSPRVLQAMSQPVLGPYNDDIFTIMDEVKEGLQYVFQTKNKLTLALTASGHGGMETIMSNLIEEGDSVLIAINGFWSERALGMAERYGGIAHSIRSPPGKNFTLAELESAITKFKPVLLFIVHGESSTGLCQPLEGLGDICHRHNCLLTVDGVASVGGVPIYVDKWGIDVLFTGSQKVLGVPPGLSPITFSPKAQERIFTRKTPMKVFYLDMKILGDYWGCFGNQRVYHHTIACNTLYGLRESLAMIAEEGLANIFARHANCAKLFYTGLEAIGLSMFVEDEEMRLHTVTTVNLPEDVKMNEIVAFCLKNYRIEVAAGIGPTVGKAVRIGLMGYNATSANVQLILHVLKEAIEWSRKNNK